MSMFLKLKRRTDVGNLAQGDDRVVEGKVVAAREMTVPGTSTKCVFYFHLTEAWQHGPRGRGRKMWVPQNVRQKCEGFYLEDGTGRVWIAGDGETMDVQGGAEESGPIGKKGKGRYLARMIRVGDVVRVRGIVDNPRGAEPGDVLVMRPTKKGVLQIVFRQ